MILLLCLLFSIQYNVLLFKPSITMEIQDRASVTETLGVGSPSSTKHALLVDYSSFRITSGQPNPPIQHNVTIVSRAFPKTEHNEISRERPGCKSKLIHLYALGLMKVAGAFLAISFLLIGIHASPAELSIPFLGFDTTTAPVFSAFPEVAFYHSQLLTGKCCPSLPLLQQPSHTSLQQPNWRLMTSTTIRTSSPTQSSNYNKWPIIFHLKLHCRFSFD